MHTTASDGSYDADALVGIAFREGVRCMAITDHDTVDSVPAGLAAGHKFGVRVLPGLELSTNYHKELHILGYQIDINSPVLKDGLRVLTEGRAERNRAMLLRLRQLGVVLDEDKIHQRARNVVSRAHIAQELVASGYVVSVQEAFERYIGPGCPGYVNGHKLSAVEAIELVVRSGGVPVLAHPRLLRMEQWEFLQLLPALIEAGLRGLEVYHPSQDETDSKWYLGVCDRHGLFATCGSDFHGDLKADNLPGCVSDNYYLTQREIQGLRLADWEQ